MKAEWAELSQGHWIRRARLSREAPSTFTHFPLDQLTMAVGLMATCASAGEVKQSASDAAAPQDKAIAFKALSTGDEIPTPCGHSSTRYYVLHPLDDSQSDNNI